MKPELMTRELFWLTLTVILTGLCGYLRPQPLPGPRSRRRDGQSVAQRQAACGMGHPPDVRARQRGGESHNLAPLVLILNAVDYSSKWTAPACAVYLGPRRPWIVYTLGSVLPHPPHHQSVSSPGGLALSNFKISIISAGLCRIGRDDRAPMAMARQMPINCCAVRRRLCGVGIVEISADTVCLGRF